MFDVITIGTATQDVYLISKYFRVVRDPHFTEKAGFPSREAQCFALGSKIEVEDMHLTTGGGATNAAVTFVRQGFRTCVISKIGNDTPGHIIEEEMRREGIACMLAKDKKAHTAYSTLFLAPRGERTILVYRGASEHLHAKDIPWPKLKTGWLYIAGGGIEFPLLQKIVNFFSRQGAFIAVNPSKAQLELGLKKLQPILDKIQICILNREEASRLAGVPHANEKKIFEVLDKAVEGILVVTDAARGVKVSDGVSRWKAGIFKERKVADRTGAGDSFGSGFVAGLMHKQNQKSKIKNQKFTDEDIKYAIRLATANATSNIESIGPKSGLLTKRGFLTDRRWQKLKINRFL